jgi:3-mercaptopyruvate sulfurtransferase SseA
MKRGYERVGVIHGGFDEWVRLGLPTQPKVGEATLRVHGSVPAPPSAADHSA